MVMVGECVVVMVGECVVVMVDECCSGYGWVSV